LQFARSITPKSCNLHGRDPVPSGTCLRGSDGPGDAKGRAVLAALAILLGQAAVSDTALQLHGFVDTYYGFDSNRPGDRLSFAAGAGTTAQRAGELRVNLAALDLLVDPKPVGVRVTLAYGTGIDALHAAERFLGPVYQAYASARVSVGRGLMLDAGIFSSHVGFEGFFSKDNFNYTRSWMGELSPYYQAGLRASYSFDEHWSAQVHFLNGWQLAGDDNRAKTLGTPIAWASGRWSVSFNTLVGPELPGDDRDFRVFADLVAQVRVSEWLTLAATTDTAFQQGPQDAHWLAAAAYARAAITRIVAVAARVEQFSDPDGAISGTAQTLREGTMTLEIRPVEPLIVKLEARHDWSTAPVFHGATPTALLTGETLLLASAVAAF